jgi:hypothetical protein
MTATDLTALFNSWVRGEPGALEHLIPHIYRDLHSLASAHLRRGASPVTLQTTAIVNDLFVKLLARQPARIENRRHFYALAPASSACHSSVTIGNAGLNVAAATINGFPCTTTRLDRCEQ